MARGHDPSVERQLPSARRQQPCGDQREAYAVPGRVDDRLELVLSPVREPKAIPDEAIDAGPHLELPATDGGQQVR